MLFPVTGDVRAEIRFGSGSSTGININFTEHPGPSEDHG